MYRELVVVGPINHPEKLVEDRLVMLVISSAQKVAKEVDIDATVLRTCYSVYIEALPMLYGENNFIFHSPSALELFRDKGLVEVGCKHHHASPAYASLLIYAHLCSSKQRVYPRSLIPFQGRMSRTTIGHSQADAHAH